ncbi:MAG: 2-amino-4-hydroxy-6-hydroxymethyldihydropteridine diphosphokinase, partial [Candidatus Heimdallarchaeota archaeon]|nr:2-amino-4-hydroxy-6-hydroxymethyldihydropteridine diphosphokinase [Candidatus Heimdallarchaeota archaeon]
MITKNKNILYLLLGSNIDPENNLKHAYRLLEKELGEVFETSSVWSSRSIGFNGPDFLNAAVKVNTTLSILDFKHEIIDKLENKLKRLRSENKNSPRTIDIDILIFNSIILDQEIWKFAHIAAPLAELLPTLINPQNQKQLKEISA